MSDGTKIEWTEATWNPITGCSRASEGCRGCYAARLAATRLRNHPSRSGLAAIDGKGEAKFNGQVRFNEGWLTQPLRWKRPRMIFVCAHADLFHENVPDEWIDRVFAVMALAPQHTFQVLTKRSARMRRYVSAIEGRTHVIIDHMFDLRESPDLAIRWPLPNVWLGVSVEDQANADIRLPDLLSTPGAVHWVSCEPLLGPVDLDCPDVDWGQYPAGNGIEPLASEGRGRLLYDWIVVGGESGPGARPMRPDWARALRDQCGRARIAFFFKQWGNHRPTSDCEHGEYMIPAQKGEAGRQLDGKLHDALPQ